MHNSNATAKRRWRLLALILALCLLGAAFAGCSKETGESGTSEPQADTSGATGGAAGSTQHYATVEELLEDEDIREQYRSTAAMLWGSGGEKTEINIYAADNCVVFSYVMEYDSDGLDLTTMRVNALQAMSKFVLPCNAISGGIASVVDAPGACLRVEILTADGVVLYLCDYADTDEE